MIETEKGPELLIDHYFLMILLRKLIDCQRPVEKEYMLIFFLACQIIVWKRALTKPKEDSTKVTLFAFVYDSWRDPALVSMAIT